MAISFPPGRDTSGHLERLQKASHRIDALVSSLPAEEIDPQFSHYLARRSYDKALAWIESGGNA